MADRPALWRHLLAMVYDTFLVAPLLMANAFVLVTVFGPTASATEPAVPSWLMQITSLMVIFAFFILFWRKSGQTLGMQAWRIQLVDEQGQPVGVRQGLTRCAAALLSLLPWGWATGGHCWMWTDEAGTTACHEAGCNWSRKRSDRQCGPQSAVRACGTAARSPQPSTALWVPTQRGSPADRRSGSRDRRSPGRCEIPHRR